MKKMFASLLSLSMILVGCGGNDDGDKKDDSKKNTIVMITDKGTIEDKSFNQGTWEGIKAYGTETGAKTEYIKPTDGTTQAYNEAIDQAVNDYKANVVVTPGYLFEASIYEKQTTYPDVKFILIDGVPNKDGQYKEFKTADNTVSIKYAEQESGYLAGYAAVKEGHTKLGFMGGQAVPAVVNFGYGYVQGANDAAKELGINIELQYKYTDSFIPDPAIQTEAASWYKSGTEIIFSCGGGIFASISAAAQQNNGLVIGVDVDQNGEGEYVLTSAYKQLAHSVQVQLKAIDDGSFKGGQDLVLSAKDEAVGLPMKTSRFKKFTQADYDTLYKKLVNDEVKIINNEGAKAVTDIKVSNVKVTLVK